MVKTKKNLIGTTIEKLTVIAQAEDYVSPSGIHYLQWLCECNCEEHNRIIVRDTSLSDGSTTSCGCVARQNASKRLKKYNKYDIDGDIVIGHSLNSDDVFYVDLKNFDKIKNIGWDVVYSQSGIKRLVGYDTETKKHILMHRLLGFHNHDHKDMNELNNLESNLRPCDNSQNCVNRHLQKHNTSGYIGVSWHKLVQKWQARININKQETVIGYFANKDDAIKARLYAELKYYGEFAPQKHLFEQYGIKESTNG